MRVLSMEKEMHVSASATVSAINFFLNVCWMSVQKPESRYSQMLFNSEELTPKTGNYHWCFSQLKLSLFLLQLWWKKGVNVVSSSGQLFPGMRQETINSLIHKEIECALLITVVLTVFECFFIKSRWLDWPLPVRKVSIAAWPSPAILRATISTS